MTVEEKQKVWTLDPYDFLSELVVIRIEDDESVLCGSEHCGIPQYDDSLAHYSADSLFATKEEAVNHFKYYKLFENGTVKEVGNPADKVHNIVG